MSIDIHPGAMGGWVADFVRANNRAAGITRDPTPEEIAAHRGLFAANVLRVENLEIFADYIDSGAVLRDESAAGSGEPASARAGLRDDLETLLVAAMRRAVPPLHLHRVYALLQPFTRANDRSGRAFWMWQAMRGTPADLEEFVELCPRETKLPAAQTSSTLM